MVIKELVYFWFEDTFSQNRNKNHKKAEINIKLIILMALDLLVI